MDENRVAGTARNVGGKVEDSVVSQATLRREPKGL
jgi:hypothetical protein